MLEKLPEPISDYCAFYAEKSPRLKRTSNGLLRIVELNTSTICFGVWTVFVHFILFAGDVRSGILLPRLFLFIPLRGRPTKVKPGDNVLLADTALEEIIFIECSIGLCFPSIH